VERRANADQDGAAFLGLISATTTLLSFPAEKQVSRLRGVIRTLRTTLLRSKMTIGN
jgi:hypothetical protein